MLYVEKLREALDIIEAEVEGAWLSDRGAAFEVEQVRLTADNFPTQEFDGW